MKKLWYGLTVLALLLSMQTPAEAQLSIGIGLPNVSIGINLPLYPDLQPVPGYPVYYAPQVDGNYFFYDGMYWVYQEDNWYASSWYNGPWAFVEPTAVPLFVLRIPVRYYRQPPSYFRGWQANAPPRWGQHWGRGWEQQRRGWDRWDRRSVPQRAPRPVYQRQYSGDRYPHQVDQQRNVRSERYRYQPRDKAIRQYYQQRPGQGRPAPDQRDRHDTPQMRDRQQPGTQQHNQQDRGDSQRPDRQGQRNDDDRSRGSNR